MQMKHGVEAKNYENLGDAAKLKPLEVELKRLEDLSESIVQDFAFMRRREVVTYKMHKLLRNYTTIPNPAVRCIAMLLF